MNAVKALRCGVLYARMHKRYPTCMLNVPGNRFFTHGCKSAENDACWLVILHSEGELFHTQTVGEEKRGKEEMKQMSSEEPL